MNIFKAIRADHDRQRELCKQLLQTQGDSDKRKHLYKALIDELNTHADAEERYFYVALIEDDMTQDHVRHGIAEHHEIDELVETLKNTEMNSSAWLVYAKQLCEKVEHHLDEEEHVFFQLAGKVFSESQKQSLARSYQQAMQKK